MPCIPTGSLLTSVVGGVRHSFMWGRRESSRGEAALQLFSADAPNVRPHVAHLDCLVLPDVPRDTLLTKT